MQHVHDTAKDWLGLPGKKAEQLFLPDDVGSYEDISPEKAVKVLRNLAETGKVDWNV